MRNLPAYSIDSVDHALRLATILQMEGPLRVADAADRLGVARSTAHRLLAMLVYRDFAEQDSSRRYAAGPILRLQGVEPVAEMRRVAWPHLQLLSEQVNETVNLLVVAADYAHVVASIECAQVLRVGNREGRMLPAHLASGGRAVLAQRSDDEIIALYSSPDTIEVDIDLLLRDLRRVRRQGFAINNQDTEPGLVAVGRALRGRSGTTIAAVSIAMPTVRYSRYQLPAITQTLVSFVDFIDRDLHAMTATNCVARTVSSIAPVSHR